MLLFENKLNEAKLKCSVEQFKSKLIKVCKTIQINPNWLMYVLFNESGLNPYAMNSIRMTGLNQLSKENVLKLTGLTPEQYRLTDALYQLSIIEKYFYNYRGRFKNVADLYLFNFMPSAVGKPLNHRIGEAKSVEFARLVRQQNKSIGTNPDSEFITVGNYYIWKMQQVKKKVTADWINILYPKESLNLNVMLIIFALLMVAVFI